MRAWLLPPGFRGEAGLLVEGRDARYLSQVLRLAPGDSFDAVDRSGRPWRCVVSEASSRAVRLAVEPSDEAPPDADSAGDGTAPIVLAAALLKGAKMDLVVRQAVEAGVTRLVPLETERSLPRAVDASGRAARWERIAREALQQSGARVPLIIEEPVPLSLLPSVWPPGEGRPGLFFHETPLDQRGLHGYLGPRVREVAVCVGPEGGFSPDETASLAAAGFAPAWLGPRVLRAETAAIYAVAAVRTILLERNSWVPSSG